MKLSSYVKQNVGQHEYDMHKYVYDLHIVNIPKIISYDKNTQKLTMQLIPSCSISDYYGESAGMISPRVFKKIQHIIKLLVDYGIEYPDITGYNFIEHRSKMWIIDFEHATKNTNITNPFIHKFINGFNEWNIEFN